MSLFRANIVRSDEIFNMNTRSIRSIKPQFDSSHISARYTKPYS